MGCILSTTKKKKFHSTVAMTVQMAENSIRSTEEKKEIPAPVVMSSSPEMSALLTRLRMDGTLLSTKEENIIASTPEISDAILLLDASKMPMTNQIVTSIVAHGKYAKKIVSALILLHENKIALTDKSISDIAAAEHFVDYVAAALIDFNNKQKGKLTENLIEGIAKAGFLAKVVGEVLCTFTRSDIRLTKKMIKAIVLADDAKQLEGALMTLLNNEIPWTEHLVCSVAKAGFHAPEVANAIVKIKDNGVLLTKSNITLLAQSKECAYVIADSIIQLERERKMAKPSDRLPPLLSDSTTERKVSRPF